jgi:hypothetical protein
MVKLITVKQAKDEIKRLQEYLKLVENYDANTIEKLIIKEYGYTNSIAEVIRILERRGVQVNGKTIEKQDVLDVIMSKPMDELHRLVK